MIWGKPYRAGHSSLSTRVSRGSPPRSPPRATGRGGDPPGIPRRPAIHDGIALAFERASQHGSKRIPVLDHENVEGARGDLGMSFQVGYNHDSTFSNGALLQRTHPGGTPAFRPSARIASSSERAAASCCSTCWREARLFAPRGSTPTLWPSPQSSD